MQFKKGDTVIYGSFGICLVKEIKSMQFVPGSPCEDYYLLSPFSGPPSTFYVPLRNSDALRKPLTQEEINMLINKAKDINISWIENRQLRAELFSGIISRGVSAELIATVNCILKRKDALTEKNRELSSTDRAFLASAEKLLQDEFSLVLKIDKDKVNSYITESFSQPSLC